MNRLGEADIHAIEAMLVNLPEKAWSRRRLQAELAARQAADGRARATS